MEKSDPAGYWFLYEGTPGGSYAPGSYYWGSDSMGPRRDLPDHLQGGRHIESMRWAYFGSNTSKRVLYVVQQEPDDIPTYLYLRQYQAGLIPDGMTVFLRPG
jgi:hypothetical protein